MVGSEISQLMKLIDEIKELQNRFNLKAHEVAILHMLAIQECTDMNYEEMKKEILERNKDNDKDYTHLF